jgi:hypothetical protein
MRTALIQRFGVMPMATATGGFAIAADGVRVEVETTANWSVNIYNDNKAAPAVQTENFKSALNVVAAQLEMDLGPAPNIAPDGKLTLRTSSKLGRVSMVTDPAMGNSATIKPLQHRLATPPSANPAVNQVAPQVQPQVINKPKIARVPAVPTPPIAPPKPPSNDQF